MKLLKNLLKIILLAFAATCAFVLFCAFNPGFTQKVADFLYADTEAETSGARAGEEDTEAFLEENGGAETLSAETADGEGEPLPQDNGEAGEAGQPDALAGEAGEWQENGTGEYVPPSQEALQLPENVSGRGGYEPVQDETQQIEEEEARELEQQIGVGNTGDDLSFDPVFYPYYAMLDEAGQHLYRQIYANACELQESFAPVEDVQVSELKNIFSAVFNDHPELFFMETAYYCKYRKNGQCAEIVLSYNRLAEDLEAETERFLAAAQDIIEQAQVFSTAYEREKLVHDMLAGRIAYDRNAEMGQSAYSGLVNGQTVCAGYARAFQYIMQQLGVPCYYCTGYAGENHAWNIIFLGDGYYNVDLTFADADEGIIYDYFNKTDEDYSLTHVRRDLAVNLPACSGQMYRSA